MSNLGSESNNAPVRKPMGRIAALLQQDEIQNGDAQGNAYERVKAMLMGNGNKSDDGDEERPLSKPNKDDKERRLPESSIPLNNSPSPARENQYDQGQQSPTSTQEIISKPRSGTPRVFVSSAEPSPVRRPFHSPGAGSGASSDSDIQGNFEGKQRLKELIARKRADLRAQREVERQRKEERLQRLAEEGSLDQVEIDFSEDDGDESGRRLTQESRRGPNRKASKKAMEEMNRETQRISRNMQLTHQAKTKKRYTTNDLFKKFGFRQEQAKPEETRPAVAYPTNLRQPEAVSSDCEIGEPKSTPPTSPPSHDEHEHKSNFGSSKIFTVHKEETRSGASNEIQSLPEQLAAKNPNASMNQIPTNTNNTIVHRAKAEVACGAEYDSDDLEIVQKKPGRFSVFDRLPAKKRKTAQPLNHLCVLAHLTSRGKAGTGNRNTYSQAELQLQLQRRARQQARVEREEKIQQLKARGIVIQTEEEREKEQLELENMLEKARQADIELAKKEKEAAKQGDKDGSAGMLESDDEDEEWQEEDGDDEADDGDEEISLSGSEDEDNVADESGRGEDLGLSKQVADADQDGEESDNDTSVARRKQPPQRRRNVVDEDDDGDIDDLQLQRLSGSTPEADVAAVFGFLKSSPALGLTQMFTGTMDRSTSPTKQSADDITHKAIDLFRNIPASTLPGADVPMPDESDEPFINNSQIGASQRYAVNRRVSQLHWPYEESHSQLSQLPEPTQDVGFQMSSSPSGTRPIPSSTVDAVVVPAGDSAVKRRGLLRRRRKRDEVSILSDLDEDNAVPEVGSDSDGDAFSVMRKETKKVGPENFNKKKSEARQMVQDQAEESEDEYAGLGGASDDDSEEEMDEEIAKMIDESDIKVDEGKIAALFAENDRAEDERRIDKLYKDITNGGLRRKRGADFDLSDSDDDGAERRRRKQREFARMRKALLEDENIGKIAENPKRQAFLRAIEDHDSDVEMNFLSEQDEEAAESVPNSQQAVDSGAIDEQSMNGKAPEKNDETCAPVHSRRTAPTGNRPTTLRKPVTLAEIRESVSFLIEDPHMVPDSQFDSSEGEADADGDGEALARNNLGNEASRFASRRTSSAVIDRLSLSRTSSSVSETSTGSLAFVAPSKVGGQGGFKVPSLLRRATSRLSETATSSTGSSAQSSGASTPAEGTKVRRGGNARSNIHYQAREAERRRVVEAAEEKRKAGLKKKASVGVTGGLKAILDSASRWD